VLQELFIFINLYFVSIILQRQIGIFSSVQNVDAQKTMHIFNDVPLFNKGTNEQYWIPTSQYGYSDVTGRPRERIDFIDDYFKFHMEVRPPLVRRRSSVLYQLPIVRGLLQLESNFSHHYEYVYCTYWSIECLTPMIFMFTGIEPLTKFSKCTPSSSRISAARTQVSMTSCTCV
jgi:hypothetical protein